MRRRRMIRDVEMEEGEGLVSGIETFNRRDMGFFFFFFVWKVCLLVG